MNACRKRGQAGGAIPFTAVALPALLVAAALALVLGQLFLVRHALYTAADLAAVAAARHVDLESLWSGRPRLDAAAAKAEALAVLRDNGIISGPGTKVTVTIEEGRVIRARKAAPEVTVGVCTQADVPLVSLADYGGLIQICVTARAAVLRPKRPWPPPVS